MFINNIPGKFLSLQKEYQDRYSKKDEKVLRRTITFCSVFVPAFEKFTTLFLGSIAITRGIVPLIMDTKIVGFKDNLIFGFWVFVICAIYFAFLVALKWYTEAKEIQRVVCTELLKEKTKEIKE